jgi:AraC-like DNA-binding protein
VPDQRRHRSGAGPGHPAPADAGHHPALRRLLWWPGPVWRNPRRPPALLAGRRPPLPTSNRELATTCDAILASELATLQNDDLESRCRAHLLHELTSGEPSDTRLAESLGLSTRTLQRKLAALGLSYRGLLEKTRYELALRYLDDPRKSVTEITFLLGFSEQSAFTRAFKRWNGKAPSDYRQSPAAKRPAGPGAKCHAPWRPGSSTVTGRPLGWARLHRPRGIRHAHHPPPTPRPPRGRRPPEGIHDEAMLIKSLILTLAREAHAGVGVLTLSIDLAGTDPARWWPSGS